MRADPFYQHISAITVSSGRYVAAGHSGRDARKQPMLMHGSLDGQQQETVILEHLSGFTPRAVASSDGQTVLLIGSQAYAPGSGPLGHARYSPARVHGSLSELRALPPLGQTSLAGMAQGWSHLAPTLDGHVALIGVDHLHVVLASVEASGSALRWWTPLDKARQVRDLLTTEQGIVVLLSDAVPGMTGQDWLVMLDHAGQRQWAVTLDAPACDRIAEHDSDLLVACRSSDEAGIRLHRYDHQGQLRTRSVLAVEPSSPRTTVLSAQEDGALLIAGVGMNENFLPTLWGQIVTEGRAVPVSALTNLSGQLSGGIAVGNGWLAAGTEQTPQGGLGRIWAIARDGSLRWRHALSAP